MGSITNLKENKTVFISCECNSEILHISYDHEEKIADFCIYESYISCFKYRMSFWQKLRYCYQIFAYNKPFSDQMTLGKKQLKELREFLNTIELE
jgi:hypothetical protein